jgi:PPM family protein phosphatase
MTHHLAYAARSDRGLIRSSNQDSVYAGNSLLVVADGMGGHAAGDMASRLVVAAFVPLDSRDSGGDLLRALAKATRQGNAAIAEVVHDNPELDGMGTTVTALLFDGGRMGMAHVGDSRAYLYRDGVLHQLTHDDTFVQSLIDDGRITQDEAAHHPQRSLLLRALNGTDVDPSLTIREVTVGDRYLICSDGLPGVVSAEAIADALANPDPGASADALIQLALVGGGPDNITVIVADVMDTGVGSGLTEARAAADADPDATGPIGTVSSVRMTQEMPRVPLPPIPEDVPARAVYAPPEPDVTDDAEDLPGAVLEETPARRSRRRRGAIILGVSLVVLAVLVIIGSFVWVRSQYYVGEQQGQVVVFRGVDGSVLGVSLSSVQEGSCEPGLNGCLPLEVDDLLPAARDQVVAGIQAGTLDDARQVVNRLAGQMLPPCPDQGTGTTLPTTATNPTSPTTPNSLPSTGTGATAGSVVPGGSLPVTPAPTTLTPTVPNPGSGVAPGAGITALPGESALSSGTVSSPLATGTPLSTRAPEPGVTCRVVR